MFVRKHDVLLQNMSFGIQSTRIFWFLIWIGRDNQILRVQCDRSRQDLNFGLKIIPNGQNFINVWSNSGRHRVDIGSTLSRHWVDIESTLRRHCVDIESTLCRHWVDIASTLSRHCVDIEPTLHWVDIGSTLSRHCADIWPTLGRKVGKGGGKNETANCTRLT